MNSSGGGGLRSALVASSSAVSFGRRRPGPGPRIARASSNLWEARSSKGVSPSAIAKRAIRLLRASPRSATRTTSRTRSRCCSVTASGVPPLAQECMRCGDTPKSCPSSAQVNPPMRRNSEVARRVVSLASSIVVSLASSIVVSVPVSGTADAGGRGGVGRVASAAVTSRMTRSLATASRKASFAGSRTNASNTKNSTSTSHLLTFSCPSAGVTAVTASISAASDSTSSGAPESGAPARRSARFRR